MRHSRAMLIVLPLLAASPVGMAWGQTYSAEQERLFTRERVLQDEIMDAPGADVEPDKTRDACTELRRISVRLSDIAVERGQSSVVPIALAWCQKGKPSPGKPIA